MAFIAILFFFAQDWGMLYLSNNRSNSDGGPVQEILLNCFSALILLNILLGSAYSSFSVVSSISPFIDIEPKMI